MTIVGLHYTTGGTQQTDYIYIFSSAASAPKLLAYCYTGDRAASGLSKAYANRGRLVIERFDPRKQVGDCCSTGIVRTRYQWRGDRFEPVGKIERGDISRSQTAP